MIMPRIDEGKIHYPSIPERICKITLPPSAQLQKARYIYISQLHNKFQCDSIKWVNIDNKRQLIHLGTPCIDYI